MFNKDIGIDLGTANVLIYIKGQGVVLNEPSVVAIDSDTKRPLAVGTEARDMLGRTPGKVKAIKPMKDGVIADFETTGIMLNYFIKKVNGKSFFARPRILICCPSNITQVEKNAIKEAAERTGARKVILEEEPKVAAVGAGMDISKPSGNMVIDIGALKENRFDDVLFDIKAVRGACEGKVLKVIIETCLLTDEQKIKMCKIVSESGADFIKTSTGFSKGGATREDIELMAKHCAPSLKIKAAGGISSIEDATIPLPSTN